MRQLAGEDTAAELDAAIAWAVQEERFARRLLECEPTAERRVLDLRAAGLSRAELIAGWVTDVVRIVIEASTPEHVGWSSPRVDTATVLATRRSISRYARDMSLNVAMIVVVFLLFVTCLALPDAIH